MYSHSRWKKPTALLGITALLFLVPSLLLSEPYKIKRGDTLAAVAHKYGTTVTVLKAANHITNVNLIHPGAVLVIPEGYTALHSSGYSQPIQHPIHRVPPVSISHPDAVQNFRRGLERGWVVTRNPEGKIFVHASSKGGYLTDLRYLVKESPDGSSWTIYRPRPGPNGNQYGPRVGVIEKPRDIDVGDCSCR